LALRPNEKRCQPAQSVETVDMICGRPSNGFQTFKLKIGAPVTPAMILAFYVCCFRVSSPLGTDGRKDERARRIMRPMSSKNLHSCDSAFIGCEGRKVIFFTFGRFEKFEINI